jgi:hypothetical protein
LIKGRQIISYLLAEQSTVLLIETKDEVILSSHDIDRECVEAIDKCLVSKLLLPLSPLVVENIIKGRNSVFLLPLG